MYREMARDFVSDHGKEEYKKSYIISLFNENAF